MRFGIGYDLHRLTPTLKKAGIPLGGVVVPCYFDVEAHSDGDVLLHAITDALLGALALGDIGQWFPDSKPENQNRPSSDFLKAAAEEVHRLGWRIENIDTNIFLQEPKIAEHAEQIRRTIAEILGLELSSVSLKAKTMEGLGPIGERKAIAAQAIVALTDAHTRH